MGSASENATQGRSLPARQLIHDFTHLGGAVGLLIDRHQQRELGPARLGLDGGEGRVVRGDDVVGHHRGAAQSEPAEHHRGDETRST